MKFLSKLLILLLLASCTSPQKALEKGSYEQAFQQVLKKLSSGKIKADDLSILEQSFAYLTNRDQEAIERLNASENPDHWPSVFETALSIDDRQKALAPVKDRLQNLGHSPDLTPIPTEELIVESRHKSALYFYARAQEHLPIARTGNREAAKKAFGWLEKSHSYVSNFKNTAETKEEMYELGTSHILIQPILDSWEEYLTGEMFESLLWNKKFPFREGWQVFHLQEPGDKNLQYRLDLSFEDLRSTGDETYTDACFNNVEIENGYIDRREWSAQDSAWIDIRVPTYITVSATINTFEQYKGVEVDLSYQLLDLASGTKVYEKVFRESSQWDNIYSTWVGDERARYGTCEDFGSIWRAFPAEEDLFIETAEKIRWLFFEELEEVIEELRG